jgi:hypothetical protein
MPTGADHLQEGLKAACAGHWWRNMGGMGEEASVSLVKGRPGQVLGFFACRYEVHEATGESIDGPLLINRSLEEKL